MLIDAGASELRAIGRPCRASRDRRRQSNDTPWCPPEGRHQKAAAAVAHRLERNLASVRRPAGREVSPGEVFGQVDRRPAAHLAHPDVRVPALIRHVGDSSTFGRPGRIDLGSDSGRHLDGVRETRNVSVRRRPEKCSQNSSCDHQDGRPSEKSNPRRAARSRRHGHITGLKLSRAERFFELLELVADVLARLEAPLRVFSEATAQKLGQIQRYRRLQIRCRLRSVLDDRRERRRRRIAMEWALSRQHFIKEDAEREDVGSLIDVFAFRLLRRHVAHRPQDAPLLGHVLRGKIAVVRRGSEPRFGLKRGRSRALSPGRRRSA